jgi:hypothetical protein
VLATSYKATARGRGGNITLPDWQFERKPGSLGLEGQEPSGGDFQPNASGQYIAVKGFGYSTDGMTQSLHGLKGLPGYDPKHENHFHHGAPDNKTALELAQYLKRKGWIITAFAPWGPVSDIHKDPGHKGGSSFDMKHGVEDHKRIMKDINDFYINKGRRGEGIQRAVGGVLNERHPYIQAIGYAEGNLDRNGRPTGSYAGHTDPGNGARNVGIFSAQNSGSTPGAANRVWLKKLNDVKSVFDNALRTRGARPGTPVYDNIMVNLLDLYVQAPAAVKGKGGLLSRVDDMIQFRGDPQYIAQARVDSFLDPGTGRLNAPGFGNNRNRLLQDQRRRVAALKERL